MKISVYSLSASDKTPQQVIELARKYQCDGVEWWCRENGHVDRANLASSAKAVKALMDGSGLAAAGLAPYLKYSETRDELARVFEAARILGAPNVRCHSYVFTGKTPVRELMRKQRGWLEAVVIPEAANAGVRLVIEQHHGQICCTPNACWQLVDGLPKECIGIIFDPGNSLFEGYTRPEYVMSVMGEYLCHVHVKSAKPATGSDSVPGGRVYPMAFGKLEDGDLDWKQILRALHAMKFKGFLSLEALDGRPSEQKLSEDIPYLQRLRAELPPS